MVTLDQRADRLNSNVGSEYKEAGRDELLRPALGRLGLQAATRKQPDHYEACEGFDKAVSAESD